MALAWKAGWVNSPQGFESPILRHTTQGLTCENADRRPPGGRSAFIVSRTRSLSSSLSWLPPGRPLLSRKPILFRRWPALACPRRGAAGGAVGASSFEMIPELVFGAGARDLVKLDVGALGPVAAATVTHTRRRAVRIDTPGSLGRTYGISGE